MKNNFYLIFTLIFFFGCSNEEVLDPTIFNPQLSIVQNLNNGVSITEVISEVGIESLYGLEYGGGYIFHIDQMQSTIMVATDFSDIGDVSWGDIFDLDTSIMVFFLNIVVYSSAKIQPLPFWNFFMSKFGPF